MTSPKSKLQPCKASQREINRLVKVAKTLNPSDVMQVARQCNAHQMHEQLMKWKESRPDLFAVVHSFFHKASHRAP